MKTVGEMWAHWRYSKLVAEVNRLESSMRELADDEFPDCYREMRKEYREGATLEKLTPRMFALVREASRRAIGIRQYDVQVEGAIALAEEKVAELKTGEGKTFIAPMAACLYALEREGVHILTANDYLAGRDHAKLQPVYKMLGLTTACVVADTHPQERHKAYQTDITYTTVVQLGFDYLREYYRQDPDHLRRENMWDYMRSEIDGSTRENRCLRGRHYAIMDEVDSILTDYARRPLSLSVQADIQHPTELYSIVRAFILDDFSSPEDFTVDAVERNVELTDRGKEKLESLKEQYAYFHLREAEWEQRVKEALSAQYLYEKGTHYVVREDTVCLIDDTSGRIKVGQRLGGELHQAIEVKEGVTVRPRQEVAKKVTIQSLIRPYEHLAGMTGTAWEARHEFKRVYSMQTVRFDPRIEDRTEFRPDRCYTESEPRWHAVIEEVIEEHETGRPVLVGTRSVEASEQVSERLKIRDVEHEVLNAVDHAAESEVIAHAGEKGRVTVATNMAGRGVEIPLGEGVGDLGGLHVVGTERHTLRRMDRQLQGRTGRRGQPGSVQFFGALEDDVFKAIDEDRRDKIREKHGDNAGRIPPPTAQKLIEKAQRRFSQHHASMRQNLLARDIAHEEGDKILFGQDKL